MTPVASFEIYYTQFLNENSEVTQTLPEFAKTPETLIYLYRIMVQTRAYDNKAIALQRTGKMGTYASTLGQEAVSTGIGYAMRKEDVLTPFYRDYAAQLQRGVNMAEIYSYSGGDERGSHFAHNAEDFPISVPIASQCLHAAGIATAFKIRNQARVAVATLGDGGTSEGDFYEAINVAGAWQLPAVFVVNNNQWAISVPREKQTYTETIAQKAIAAGFAGEQVDGNDVIAMTHVMQQAIEKARTGGGPTLIEAITYRLCDHTTADDATRYRDKTQWEEAEKREPIARLKTYLMHINAWDDDKEKALQEECKQNVEKAVEDYIKKSPQPIESIFDYHYAELPDALLEQRQQVLEDINNV